MASCVVGTVQIEPLNVQKQNIVNQIENTNLNQYNFKFEEKMDQNVCTLCELFFSEYESYRKTFESLNYKPFIFGINSC